MSLGHVRLSTLVLVTICGFAATTHAFSSGPPDAHTGAPGELVCTRCHTSFPLNSGTGSLSVSDAPGDGYEPGQTYRLRVRLEDPSAQRWGFELTSLDAANAFAGDLVSIDGTTQTSTATSGREYLKHTSSGTAFGTTGSNEWAFDWVAPAAGTGPVTLWFAGNAANGNFANTGDRIYATSATIEEAVTTDTPAAAVATRLLPNVPNPFNPTTRIRFDLREDAPVSLHVFDGRGRRVRTLVDAPRTAGRHEVVWDGRNDAGDVLASGVYRARLVAGEEIHTRTLTLVQ